MTDGSGLSASSIPPETLDGSYVPLICRHASSVQVEDKTFVYDERLHTMMVLNPAAAAIWSGCDGETSVEHLAEQLSAAYAEGLEQVRSDVMATVAKLADLGVLEHREPLGGRWPRSPS
jgi:hypothetical protein